MARGINKVILVGNLGADPEVRYTGSGTAVAQLRLATTENWTDRQSGERQERTEWHRVTLFGKLGEIAGEYLKKGRQVYIEGALRTNKYTDKDGIERYTTDIIASDMQMLGGGGEGGAMGGGGSRERPQAPSRSTPPTRGSQREESYAPPSAPGPDHGSFDDDDIPF